MSTEDFLADIEQDGDNKDPFGLDDKQTDKTATDSPSENKEEKESEEDSTQPKEKETPTSEDKETRTEEKFHKRWQDRETKLRDELSDELESLKEGYESRISDLEKSNEPVPEEYLDDEAAYKRSLAKEKLLEKKIEDKIFGKMEAEQESKRVEADKWQGWIDDQIVDLKDQGKSFDENEFLTFIYKYKPTDVRGNLDFKGGYELFSLRKSKEVSKKDEKSTARKEVADKTTSDDKSEPERDGIMNWQDTKKKGWGHWLPD